jgi:hypothetical protein
VDEQRRLGLALELALGRDALAQFAQPAAERRRRGQALAVREDADGDGLGSFGRLGERVAEFHQEACLFVHREFLFRSGFVSPYARRV